MKAYLRTPALRAGAAKMASPAKEKHAVRASDVPPAYLGEHEARIAALSLHHAQVMAGRGQANKRQLALLSGV